MAVAGDVAEAEQLQGLLTTAGIESRLEPAVEHDPDTPDDPPLKVLVPEAEVEDAREAIEALSDARGRAARSRLARRHPLDARRADEAFALELEEARIVVGTGAKRGNRAGPPPARLRLNGEPRAVRSP